MHSDVPAELRRFQVAQESPNALVEEAVELDLSAASQARECRAPRRLWSALCSDPLPFLPLTRLIDPSICPVETFPSTFDVEEPEDLVDQQLRVSEQLLFKALASQFASRFMHQMSRKARRHLRRVFSDVWLRYQPCSYQRSHERPLAQEVITGE